MDNALINTAATHETRNEPQEGVPKPSASPVLDGSCAPSTSTNLACRLVHIALALYLIPAFLIVLLEGEWECWLLGWAGCSPVCWVPGTPYPNEEGCIRRAAPGQRDQAGRLGLPDTIPLNETAGRHGLCFMVD